jgi:hypothetical protein
MLNNRQKENETGGIADASVDASFSVSVSNRGSGAAKQHNFPYPPGPLGSLENVVGFVSRRFEGT